MFINRKFANNLHNIGKKVLLIFLNVCSELCAMLFFYIGMRKLKMKVW